MEAYKTIESFFKGLGLPASETDILEFALIAGAVKARDVAGSPAAQEYAAAVKAHFVDMTEQIKSQENEQHE